MSDDDGINAFEATEEAAPFVERWIADHSPDYPFSWLCWDNEVRPLLNRILAKTDDDFEEHSIEDEIGVFAFLVSSRLTIRRVAHLLGLDALTLEMALECSTKT